MFLRHGYPKCLPAVLQSGINEAGVFLWPMECKIKAGRITITQGKREERVRMCEKMANSAEGKKFGGRLVLGSEEVTPKSLEARTNITSSSLAR